MSRLAFLARAPQQAVIVYHIVVHKRGTETTGPSIIHTKNPTLHHTVVNNNGMVCCKNRLMLVA